MAIAAGLGTGERSPRPWSVRFGSYHTPVVAAKDRANGKPAHSPSVGRHDRIVVAPERRNRLELAGTATDTTQRDRVPPGFRIDGRAPPPNAEKDLTFI